MSKAIAAARSSSADETSWLVCPGCSAMVYRKRFVRAGHVCPECGWHSPLTARQRLDLLLDADSLELLDFSLADSDPLDFTDTSAVWRPKMRRALEETEIHGQGVATTAEFLGELLAHPRVCAAEHDTALIGSLAAA